MALHQFNLRMLAEDLVRVRRPDDRERYAASQRQARIDPNPHQIDAVIFALRRLREGGCILADEVGLGKTIEAGLVIAQSRADATHGRAGILLVDRTNLRLQPGSDGIFPDDLPPVVKDTIARLDHIIEAADDEAEKVRATRALAHLYKLLQSHEAVLGRGR